MSSPLPLSTDPTLATPLPGDTPQHGGESVLSPYATEGISDLETFAKALECWVHLGHITCVVAEECYQGASLGVMDLPAALKKVVEAWNSCPPKDPDVQPTLPSTTPLSSPTTSRIPGPTAGSQDVLSDETASPSCYLEAPFREKDGEKLDI